MAQEPFAAVLEYLRRVCAKQELRNLADADLLERFVTNREDAAFAVLVQRHGPMVLAVCQRVLGDHHNAEDAFQATFVVLVRRAAAIRREAPLSNWLYAVAQRVALKARAKLAARQSRQRELSDMPRAEPLDELTWQELRPVLDEEIARLPQKCRAAIVLCYFEGKSYDQAAQELGWPKSSLASRLARGRELLRQRLVKRGIALSVGALTTALTEKTAGAAVGAMLTIKTAKAAAGLAAGKTVAETILSAHAIALAEEVMRGMFAINVKLVVVVLALGFAVGGAGVAGYQGLGGRGNGGEPGPAPATIQIAPLENTAVAKQQKQEAPAVDLYGDPLPTGALARLGTARWRHGGITGFVVYLPDGKRLISASHDGVFHVWEYPSGKEIQRFGPGVQEPVPPPIRFRDFAIPVAVSADCKILAYYHDESEVRVYEVSTGKTLATLKHKGRISSQLAISPDGQHVAVRSFRGLVTIWDWRVQQTQEIDVQHGAMFPNSSPLIYAPDGKLLAMTCNELGDNNMPKSTIKLVDPAKSKDEQIRTLEFDGPTFVHDLNLTFSPNGKMLACCDIMTRALHVVDVEAGKQIGKFKVKGDIRNGVAAVAFSRDSKSIIARSLYDQSVRVWDVNTGEELRSFAPVAQLEPPDYQGITPPALSPDGSVLALAGIDHSLRFLALGTGKEVHGDTANSMAVTALGWAADGKRLWAQSYGKSLWQWDGTTGKPLNPVPLPVNSFNAALSADGKSIATAPIGDKPGKIIAIDTGKQVGQVRPTANDEQSRPTHMVFSADGLLLAVRWEDRQKLEIYSAAHDKLLFTLDISTANQTGSGQSAFLRWAAMLFSPDSKYVAAYSAPGVLSVWATVNGRRLADLPTTDAAPLAAAFAFSPDSRSIALKKRAGNVVLWELATCKERRNFTPRKAFIPSLEPFVLNGYGMTVPSAPPAMNLAFSTKGDLLAHGAADGIIRVWLVDTGQELASLSGHSGVINALAFSPGGKTLASASADTTILTWDLRAALAKRLPQRVFTDMELETSWDTLASDDAQLAFTTICQLAAASKDTVTFLRTHLKPATLPDSKRVEELLAQLDAKQFQLRQKATGELLQLGDQIVPALDKALAANPPLEAKQRLEALRGKLTGMILEGERLRGFRAVEVLELIGTPEARAVLQALADGAPGALLTVSAQAALKR